jgi:hypothetical protein
MKKGNGTADGRRWTQIWPEMLEVVDDAANFQTRMAEVEEQCQAQAGGFQIVHALREVDAVEGSHCFQFDDDAVINNQIGGVFPDDNSVVSNDDRMLLRDAEAVFPQLVSQAILVHLFQKSGSHFVQDGECATDDALGDPVQSTFICVHLRSSAVRIASPADRLSSGL